MAITKSRLVSNLAHEIQTENFKVLCDVPPKLGGNDIAPGPHEYLEIALAGCTALTLQMYAKRKEMKLEGVDVKIKITKEGMENEISREIKLVGELSDTEKERLLDIANKCPIHHFLTRGAKIHSSLI